MIYPWVAKWVAKIIPGLGNSGTLCTPVTLMNSVVKNMKVEQSRIGRRDLQLKQNCSLKQLTEQKWVCFELYYTSFGRKENCLVIFGCV
jgi:hypothetical protein